ncbi:MAG: helix-turn-helix transcriptional regulator, partial [Ilumatobacteraceae bacterium]
VLTRAIEQATAREQWTHVAELWHEAARLDVLDLLTGLDDWPRPTARLARARFAFVHARKSGDLPALEDAAAAFEDLGALLYAAEAAASAALMARRQGATKDAVRLDGLAGTLLARCGGANTPLLSSRSSSGPLSAREGEIARLAADGLSNRQIAERLVVSERTVENHLYRIFIKLGVSARDELARALTPR